MLYQAQGFHHAGGQAAAGLERIGFDTHEDIRFTIIGGHRAYRRRTVQVEQIWTKLT